MNDGTIVGGCTVRESARAAIQTGKLPNRSPDRMWGGRGSDADCAICGAPVKRDALELEIEFSQNGDTPRAVTHHVHVRCFAAWEFERDNLDLVRGGRPQVDDKG